MNDELGALSLVPTDALIEELFHRYEHGVIGLERATKTDAKVGSYKIRWKGSGFIAQGLACCLIDDINAYRVENEDPGDEDE